MHEFWVRLANGQYEGFFAQRTTAIVFAFTIIASLVAYFAGKRRDIVSDLAVKNTLATLGIFAVNLALLPVTIAFADWLGGVYAGLAIPRLPASFWDGMPVVVALVLGFAAKDFVDYWNHRLMHTKWVWPIHAVHHSDTHVNGFTAFRVHTLETVYMKASYIAFLSWLGLPSYQIGLVSLLESLHIAYVHFEADIDHGPLNWLLASPRFHRWHHADTPAIFGKNLANHIPLYDMLFGTYHNPGACQDAMGALSDDIPDRNVVKLAVLPFVLWKRRYEKTVAAHPLLPAQKIGANQ